MIDLAMESAVLDSIAFEFMIRKPFHRCTGFFKVQYYFSSGNTYVWRIAGPLVTH